MTTATSSALSRNGQASWSARAASRVSFQATRIRLGAAGQTPCSGATSTGPPGQAQGGGVDHATAHAGDRARRKDHKVGSARRADEFVIGVAVDQAPLEGGRGQVGRAPKGLFGRLDSTLFVRVVLRLQRLRGGAGQIGEPFCGEDVARVGHAQVDAGQPGLRFAGDGARQRAAPGRRRTVVNMNEDVAKAHDAAPSDAQALSAVWSALPLIAIKRLRGIGQTSPRCASSGSAPKAPPAHRASVARSTASRRKSPARKPRSAKFG